MAIYTLQQLRATAPPEFRDLPEEELVRKYSQSTGTSFEQAADYFGVKPRGTLAEMGRQALGGAVVDLPKMVGQGLQYTGIAPEFGRELVEGAEARAPEYTPDMRGRGLLGQAGVLGARGLAPVAATLPLAFVPGGQVAAPLAAATLFGTSSAQETYDKLISQGATEEDALAAARRVGMIQGPLEGVATAVGLRAARPLATALGAAPKTTSGIASALTETAVAKPFAKGMATNLAVQPGTEVAQDVGSSLVERAYGAAPEDLGEMAKQSALGGVGLTLLLGPLAGGAAITRARRAQSLKDALYNPDTPVETRAKAMDLVMGEARRQGVAEQDVDTWFNQQLELEDARTAALRAAEQEEKTKQINLLGEQAQELEGLQGGVFSSLDQQRAFEQGLAGVQIDTPFSSLEQQQAFTQGLETARDNSIARVGQQYQDLMGDRASTLMQAQDLGEQAQDILEPQQRGLTAATQAGEQWQEIRAGKSRTMMDIDDMGQEWQKLAKDLPQPVTGELSRAQKAALRGPEGKRLKPTSSPFVPTGQGPASTTLLEPAQGTLPAAVPTPTPAPSSLLSERPAEPVTPDGAADAVAAALPAATGAAGVSSTVTTGVPSGTQASQAKQAKTQRTKAPAAPAAPAVVDTAAAQNVSDAIKEDNEIDRVLKAVEAEDDKADKLFASVTGDTKKAPGKPSMPAQVYAAIRNAILNPGKAVVVRKAKSVEKDAAATEKYGAKAKRIADAAREFAAAYEAYASQNLVRPDKVTKRTETADDVVAANATRLKEKAAAVQQALAKLGEAVEGNAKDVEAVVRFVKDRAQKEKKGDVKVEKADITLSRAWTAAKSESFMGEPDLLATTGAEVRQSREAAAKGATPQLVDAATEGYATFGRGPVQTGLNGILNYIRTVGTPFEKTLAQAIKLAVAGKAPINIKFVKEGTSQYDPKTNTITINETSSKEVALHEALHGALQWYVYNNPNAAQVVALKTALQRVVNYDGKLPPKAAEVQALLKKILAGKSKTAELDAVLELVSYGNTLNDFRRALQGMESNAPRTFTKFANDVMDAIYALVRRMLGSSQTVASDVMDNTFQLLEAARAATQETAPKKGNVLQAAVQTSTAPSQQAQTIQAGLEQSRNELAQEAGFSNYNTYKDRPSTPFNLTRILFEQVGFGKGGRVDKALKGAAQKSADIIRKEFPALEYVILNLNSKFGQSPSFQRLSDFFKQDAQTGLLEAEYVSQYIYRNPQDAENIIRYLDGDKTALADTGRDATLRSMGDNILRHINEYMTTLPVKDRRLFENMKFSDYVLNPQSIAQLAGKTVGIRALREKVATESRTETNIEDFKKFLTFTDGVLDSDVPMYQLFETIPDGKGNMIRVPQGFISKDKIAQNPGMDVDRSRVWYLDAPAKEDSNSFVFKTRAVTGERLRDISGKLSSGTLTPVEREQAVQQISAAMVNTIAALSHNYAATNLFSGINSIGRAEDGSVTPQSIAFDDVNQINDTFKDRKITDANVLEVSSDEARAYSIRGEAQRSGVWVRLPEKDTYGALKGKIVPGTVWNAMLDMNDRTPLLNSQVLSDIMTSFKKAKTVLTPATHSNNILTNYALMLLHGIPHKALQDAARLMYRYEVNPKALSKDQLRLMQEFYRSGAVLGQFTNTEAKKFITQRLAENIRPENDRSMLEKLGAWAGVERDTEQLLARASRAGKLTDNFFTEVYAAGDNVFRLAAFLNTAGNIQAAAGDKSLSDSQIREAGLAARKLFLDYDIDARWVRAARQSFLPFVSWAYAITPVLGRLAIEKPWTMVNMMAALGIMGSMLDGGDDEWRKKGPEQVRDMFLGMVPSYYRIPFMGNDENPVYYNLGKSIPFISLFQPAQGQSKLFGQDWFPSVLNPGGPYTSIISSVLFGTDAFTGKPLADATDTQLNKFLKGAESVYNTMVPSVASTRLWGPEEGEIAKLLQNRTGPTGVEPDALFIARTFGLSAYEFNRSETEFWQDGQIKKLKREFDTVMNKAKRDEYAKGYPDYEALDEKLADLRTRLEERINKIRGEE